MFGFITPKREESKKNLIAVILQDISHNAISALINADMSIKKIEKNIFDDAADQEDLLREIKFVKNELCFLLNFFRIISRWFCCCKVGDKEELSIKQSIKEVLLSYPVRNRTDECISKTNIILKDFLFFMSFTDFSYVIKRIFYVISFFSKSERNEIDIISRHIEKEVVIKTLMPVPKGVDNLFDVRFPKNEKENTFWGLSDVISILEEYNYSLYITENNDGHLMFTINFGDGK